MVLFRVERRSPHSADETWRRLTTWERHADAVPLTRVAVLTAAPSGVGTTFVARTGVGPLGFDDPMEVTRWRPPGPGRTGLCRLEKRGRLVLGWAEIEVRGSGQETDVVWRESLSLRGAPQLLDPVLVLLCRRLFARAAARLLDTA